MVSVVSDYKLSNPGAGVTLRKRIVDLVGAGCQKRKREKCESDEFFHGVVILFLLFCDGQVVPNYTGPDRYRVFHQYFPKLEH